jgi:hypothetical protein
VYAQKNNGIDGNRKRTSESWKIMTTKLPGTRQADRIGFPWDLADWVERAELLCWVKEEIETLDWKNPRLVEYLRTHPDYRPRVLLTLLTYAYVTGVYASEDIAEHCYSDPTFRSICASDAPTTREITAFRRENRGLLKWGLQQMLKRALRTQFDVGNGSLAAGLRRYVAVAATTRLDVARHLDGAALAA